MKKFLFVISAVAVSVAANAEVIEITDRPADAAVVNRLANGNFEAEGFVQSTEPEYTWDEVKDLEIIKSADAIPGWTAAGFDKWNGNIWIQENEVDDEYILEGNKYCLHFRHHDDNGWENVRIWQVVKGLDTNVEYTLDWLMAHEWGDPVIDWANPTCGVVVKEGSADGKSIVSADGLGTQISQWEAFQIKFKPTSSDVYIEFYSSYKSYKGNKHGTSWSDLDEARLYDPNEEPSGLGSVAVDASASVEYFTLQGIRVAHPENGVFIARQGNKTWKEVR